MAFLEIPLVFFRSEALSSDETVCGLKSELERCLTNYRNKRTQVTKLQQDLRTASSERDRAQGKLDTTQQQLTRKEVGKNNKHSDFNSQHKHKQ